MQFVFKEHCIERLQEFAGGDVVIRLQPVAKALSERVIVYETDRIYIAVEGYGVFALRPSYDKNTWNVTTFISVKRLSKDKGNAKRAYAQGIEANKASNNRRAA